MYKNNQTATGQDSLYASAVMDKKANELIIKTVNASKNTQNTEINVERLNLAARAKLIVLQNDNLEAENTLEDPNVIVPSEEEIDTTNKSILLALKGYSFSVIRVKY